MQFGPGASLEADHVPLGLETDREGVLEAVDLLLRDGLLSPTFSLDLRRCLSLRLPTGPASSDQAGTGSPRRAPAGIAADDLPDQGTRSRPRYGTSGPGALADSLSLFSRRVSLLLLLLSLARQLEGIAAGVVDRPAVALGFVPALLFLSLSIRGKDMDVHGRGKRSLTSGGSDLR